MDFSWLDTARERRPAQHAQQLSHHQPDRDHHGYAAKPLRPFADREDGETYFGHSARNSCHMETAVTAQETIVLGLGNDRCRAGKIRNCPRASRGAAATARG